MFACGPSLLCACHGVPDGEAGAYTCACCINADLWDDAGLQHAYLLHTRAS